MFTIVIPTLNRGPSLERLLSYYCEQKFKEPVVIADSTDPDRVEGTRRAVESAREHLNIEYRLYPPGIEFLEKLGGAVDAVQTEFVTVGADDDFFTAAGLKRAAGFLQMNLEFSAAHGKAMTFEMPYDSATGRLQTWNYPQRSLEHASAADRLAYHLGHYSTTWHSMQRTARLRQNLLKLADTRFGFTTFAELLLSCLSVIRGKTRSFDGLYMARQVYPKRKLAGSNIFEWVSSTEWGSQYARFEACLVEGLIQQDNIPRDAATEVVKSAFWLYLSQALTKKWNERYASDYSAQARSLERKVARGVPGASAVWQQVRSLLGGKQNEMLLPALLRPSSPYHSDFMPIYRAIAGDIH